LCVVCSWVFCVLVLQLLFVFKAMALGANAVMLGRPQLYALSVAGALGVAHMLRIIREELEVTMALAGAPTINSISSENLTLG
jgi:4-hydroxymandelate oxidase